MECGENAMLEIRQFEDITQIRMSREVDGKPLYWVAAYLVDGLLIDSGCSYTVCELIDYLEKFPPDLAVNTHYHEDHIGANRRIQMRFGINIYAPPESIPLIGRKAALFPYQELTWGYPEPSDVLPIASTIRTKKFLFEVIEVPGHSPDHIALLERSQGWCFSGDAFVGRKVKTIRPEEEMETTILSLRKLACLETKRLVLLTSLGQIFEDGREAIASFEEFISGISGRVRELNKRGRSIPEIVIDLFGGEDPWALLTNGQFSREHLIRSILKMHSTNSQSK
jgi:glyoxylase-like metal-dependent hydrolase (beta-lactamase superfamily II)